MPDERQASLSWRSWYGLPVIALALHGALVWLGRVPGILTNEDSLRYVVLARALTLGQYSDLMTPGTPAHHLYPPGFPALLAIWTAIGGEGFTWLVLQQIAFSVAALAITFVTLRRAASPLVAIATLITLAMNPALVASAGEIMSESALTFFFALAIWASACMAPGPRQAAVLIAAGIAAVTVRTAGLVLPVAIVAHLLWGRRVREAGIATVLFAMTLGPLIWWTARNPTAVVGLSYAADLTVTARGSGSLAREFVQRMTMNLQYYVTIAMPNVLAVPTIAGTIIDNLVSTAIVLAGVVVGMVRSLSRMRVAGLTLFASAGLYLIWTWRVERYLVPLIPIVITLLLLGVERIGLARSRRTATIAVVAMSAILVSTSVVRLQGHLEKFVGCDRERVFTDPRCVTPGARSFFAAARYVHDSLPQGARLAAVKATSVYYYTGRQTTPLQPLVPLDPMTFNAQLTAASVEYVLLASIHSGDLRLSRLLSERCRRLRVTASFAPRTHLFALLETPAADTTACAVINEYRRESARAFGGE